MFLQFIRLIYFEIVNFAASFPVICINISQMKKLETEVDTQALSTEQAVIFRNFC